MAIPAQKHKRKKNSKQHEKKDEYSRFLKRLYLRIVFDTIGHEGVIRNEINK